MKIIFYITSSATYKQYKSYSCYPGFTLVALNDKSLMTVSLKSHLFFNTITKASISYAISFKLIESFVYFQLVKEM